MIELTDREVAVTLDSLAMTRDRIREEGRATPAIDSTLAKLQGIVRPNTAGLRVEPFELNPSPPCADDLRAGGWLQRGGGTVWEHPETHEAYAVDEALQIEADRRAGT